MYLNTPLLFFPRYPILPDMLLAKHFGVLRIPFACVLAAVLVPLLYTFECHYGASFLVPKDGYNRFDIGKHRDQRLAGHPWHEWATMPNLLIAAVQARLV